MKHRLSAVSEQRRFPYLAIGTLAFAIFLIVTIELIPTGLITVIGEDLRLPTATIGLLVSVFAFTVAFATAPLTALTRRFDRRRLLLFLLVMVAAGALLSAVAPNYLVLLLSRILGGLAHGVFWAVAGAYPSYIVPEELIGRGVAVVFGGVAAASTFGVPVGTYFAQSYGWRPVFLVLSVMTLIGIIVAARFLPATHSDPRRERERLEALVEAEELGLQEEHLQAPGQEEPAAPERMPEPMPHEAPRINRSQRRVAQALVVLVCAVACLVMMGQYSFYTYVMPYLQQVKGMTGEQASLMLFGFGLAAIIGLILIGIWLGKRPRASLAVALGAMMAVTVGVMLAPPGWWLVVLFLFWGLFRNLMPPLMQTLTLLAAPDRLRDQASAFYVASFNLGIALGALLGAWVLPAVGLAELPWVLVLLTGIALILLLVTEQLLRLARWRSAAEDTRTGPLTIEGFTPE